MDDEIRPVKGATEESLIQSVVSTLLARETEDDPRIWSTTMIAEALGCGREKALRTIKKMVRAGLLEGGIRVKTETVHGITTTALRFRYVGPWPDESDLEARS